MTKLLVSAKLPQSNLKVPSGSDLSVVGSSCLRCIPHFYTGIPVYYMINKGKFTYSCILLVPDPYTSRPAHGKPYNI